MAAIQDSPLTLTEVSYFVDYYEEVSQYWNFVYGLLIASQFFILVMVGIHMYYFLRDNPHSSLGKKFTQTFVIKLIYVLVDQWATTMFWISFFVNAYWFIMFKMQDNAYSLLPTTNTDQS